MGGDPTVLIAALDSNLRKPVPLEKDTRSRVVYGANHRAEHRHGKPVPLEKETQSRMVYDANHCRWTRPWGNRFAAAILSPAQCGLFPPLKPLQK
jgi:hypothetical protein